MNYRMLTGLFVTLALVGGVAQGADERQLTLTVTTLDDDMRAGGTAEFVLVMRDGREQTTPLTRGEGLSTGRTLNPRVGPKPPYLWRDVAKFGVRARLHGGDGALLQADKWRVSFTLSGDTGCDPRRLAPGATCIGTRGGAYTFEREQTHLLDITSRVAQCQQDFDCPASNRADACSTRTARCSASSAGADFMGCVRSTTPVPACRAHESCSAAQGRCVARGCDNPDADGDGEPSIACGGADCDDNDRERAPARTEVCDEKGKDEDCNPVTFGDRDLDRDGHVDAMCWNDG